MADKDHQISSSSRGPISFMNAITAMIDWATSSQPSSSSREFRIKFRNTRRFLEFATFGIYQRSVRCSDQQLVIPLHLRVLIQQHRQCPDRAPSSTTWTITWTCVRKLRSIQSRVKRMLSGKMLKTSNEAPSEMALIVSTSRVFKEFEKEPCEMNGFCGSVCFLIPN